METRSSKNKVLLIAVIILLLTNIGILAFFLADKGGDKGGPRGNREVMINTFLQKDIGFDKAQMDAYDSLNKRNKEAMKASFDQIRNNRQVLYKELGGQSFSDSAIQVAAAKVADKQKEIEVKMLSHFAAVRKICTPAQQVKFDSLFYKIWNKKDKPGN